MKKYSFLQPLGYIVSLLCISCCGSCDSDEECFTPPPDFVFDVRNEDNVSILSRYQEQDIRLYYLDENDRPINVDFRKEGAIFSNQLPFLSIEGKNPFYLEMDSMTDTLLVEVQRDKSVDDCTAYFYRYVGVNGKEANVDASATNIPPVFVVTR